MSQIANLAPAGSSPAGDVSGPGSSTDNAIVLWDGTTGAAIKDSSTIMLEGTGATSGAVTDDVITVALGASARAFSFHVLVVGFESTTPAGISYEMVAGARTDGASATIIGTADVTSNEEAALSAASIDMVASGNNAIVRVTGVAALDINWRATLKYVGVS